MVMFCMYECGKHSLHSTYERAHAAHETTIIHMKNTVEIFNYEIKDISSTNREILSYIDSCHKEPERCASYLEKSTLQFENVVNITINSDSVIPK